MASKGRHAPDRTFSPAVQIIEDARDEGAAKAAASFFATQLDLIGARIMQPTAMRAGWRVQAFFKDSPKLLPTDLLNTQRVLLPRKLRKSLPIRFRRTQP